MSPPQQQPSITISVSTPAWHNAHIMACETEASGATVISNEPSHKDPTPIRHTIVHDIEIQTDTICCSSSIQMDPSIVEKKTLSIQFPCMKKRSVQTTKAMAVTCDTQTDALEYKESVSQCSISPDTRVSTSTLTEQYVGTGNSMVTEP